MVEEKVVPTKNTFSKQGIPRVQYTGPPISWMAEEKVIPQKKHLRQARNSQSRIHWSTNKYFALMFDLLNMTNDKSSYAGTKVKNPLRNIEWI